ncbi:MAG: TIGR01212 family radical SAM protein [Bacteroidales bacterium]|nr:TIGR01212 family radical SAM protein [Bacteroidales bacterium]
MFPWHDDRRFNSYSSYISREFGSRVQKISIDAGFSCPNRDGTISTGGCTFCRNDAFNPSYCKPEKSIRQQIEEGIEFHKRRYRRATSYLAYFQAFTNTHKPIAELERLYREALSVPGIIGLVIGTRPDCITSEILEMLKTLSYQRSAYPSYQRSAYPIIIELGVESPYDSTLSRINRGHDFATARNAIELVHSYGFPCGAHLIFGLPGETRKMMLDTANIISELPLTSVKFHQLQIFKDTKMADEYLANPADFHLFSLDDYIEFVIDFIERLNPNIVIERFAGEVPPRYLVSKPWLNLRYDQVLALIEKRLEERNTFQGKKF